MKCKIRLKEIAASFLLALFTFVIAVFVAPQSSAAPAVQETSKPGASLDYEFFKARVEPIFLKIGRATLDATPATRWVPPPDIL